MKKGLLVALSMFTGLQAMAGMKLCFHINGQLHCIEIPVEVNREWPWDVRTFDPGLTHETQKDIAILHLMDNLAGQLTPELGRLIQEEVQALGSSFEFGSGAKLVVHKSRTDGSNQWELHLNEQGINVTVPNAYNFDQAEISETVFGPDPVPWIVYEAIDQDTLRNLSILATLDDMTSDLSRDVAQKVDNAIVEAVDQLQLPKDVQIRM